MANCWTGCDADCVYVDLCTLVPVRVLLLCMSHLPTYAFFGYAHTYIASWVCWGSYCCHLFEHKPQGDFLIEPTSLLTGGVKAFRWQMCESGIEVDEWIIYVISGDM